MDNKNINLITEALKDMDLKPMSITLELNQEQILQLGFTHAPTEEDVVKVLKEMISKKESVFPRLSQRYPNDEDKVWCYFVKDTPNPCGCGSNVFHKEYDVLKEKIYGVCNSCGKDVYEVEPEFKQEELCKGVWKIMKKITYHDIVSDFNNRGIVYEGTHSLINFALKYYPNQYEEFCVIIEKISAGTNSEYDLIRPL